MERRVIAITGGTATGKGTLTRAIGKRLDIAVLAQDDYYHTKPNGIPSSQYNYDHPDAIDLEMLADHLLALKAGQPVDSPIYVHAESSRVGSRPVLPAPVIVVEGILIMNNERLRRGFDLTVYLDLDHGTQLARRIARDTVERGCTEAQVRHMWENTVLPMQKLYVEPFKEGCNLILPEDHPDLMAEAVIAALEVR
jgi:uridine kinase